MTCVKQEFCIHEKYCQRHIGQNFDSCILFSRNSKPMTNEEYLRSCTTEQLAEQITDIVWECKEQDDCMDCKLGWCSKDYVVEWLKQPHTNE